MKYNKKLPGYNLQEILVALAIIGIILLLAMPRLMPLINRVKSNEAQFQLKHVHTLQTMYMYMNSKYNIELKGIDFEAPKTVNENGTANYIYEIISATNNSFIARATAITDFDGDGNFSVWEIDESGIPKEIEKD